MTLKDTHWKDNLPYLRGNKDKPRKEDILYLDKTSPQVLSCPYRHREETPNSRKEDTSRDSLECHMTIPYITRSR